MEDEKRVLGLPPVYVGTREARYDLLRCVLAFDQAKSLAARVTANGNGVLAIHLFVQGVRSAVDAFYTAYVSVDHCLREVWVPDMLVVPVDLAEQREFMLQGLERLCSALSSVEYALRVNEQRSEYRQQWITHGFADNLLRMCDIVIQSLQEYHVLLACTVQFTRGGTADSSQRIATSRRKRHKYGRGKRVLS